jgi:DNA-binding response OmpR family regulator
MEAKGIRVLIIGDEAGDAAIVRAGLEAQGGHVVDVVDVGTARTWPASCDLLVLDVELGGVHAWSMLEELRREHPALPVLLLTTFDSVSDRVRGLDLGADD